MNTLGRNKHDPVVWLLGDGRCGTTRIAELINHDSSARELFDPFHPQAIPDANFLIPQRYLRTLKESADLGMFFYSLIHFHLT